MNKRIIRLACFVLILISLSASSMAKTTSKTVTYKSGAEEVSGYLTMPEAKGTYPAVILVHEWWGLNGWAKQMADSLAAEGYVVLALDLYRGKVTAKPDEAGQLLSGLPADRATKDLESAYAYLTSLPETKGKKVGTIGWCMGGKFALIAAEKLGANLSACVVNYGFFAVDKKMLGSVKAATQGNFGALDKGIPVEGKDGVKALESTLKEGGVTTDFKVYEKSGHAFMNNANGMNSYNAADAKDAWQRTLAFFGKHLKA